MNASPQKMWFILVFAPILSVTGYIQFKGGFSTSLLLAVFVLHGLLAVVSGLVLGKKQWALQLLMVGLVLVFVWYAFVMVMGLMGLAAGGFNDPSQRPAIFAMFATCLFGLGTAGWMLFSIGLSCRDNFKNKNRIP